MIMLIQHAEKRENSSSKSYEMSKWSFLAMVLWELIEILFTATLHFTSIEIPDYAQVNDELYTFSRTFLAKEPIYKFTLEIYASFLICVLFLLTLLQIICQILDCWDIQTLFKYLPK